MTGNATTLGRIRKITVGEHTGIREALGILNDMGLGILLVNNRDHQLAGVVTDGDVRRYIMQQHSMDAEISRVMNRDFFYLKSNEKHRAFELLKQKRIEQIPILDADGRIVDLVFALDFLKRQKKIMKNAVVIMAGGRGERLAPLTRIIPKPLVPVGDRTMIELIMSGFANYGFNDFKIIVNYKKEIIKSYFKENEVAFNYEFIDEKEYLGTAGGLSLAREKINDTFILTNCDVTAEIDYGHLLDWHREKKADLTILGIKKKFDIPYGVIKTDASHCVTVIEEKPKYEFYVISGIYVIEPNIIKDMVENEVLDMNFFLERMQQKGKKVLCYPIDNGWYDVGQFKEYKKMLTHFGEIYESI